MTAAVHLFAAIYLVADNAVRSSSTSTTRVSLYLFVFWRQHSVAFKRNNCFWYFLLWEWEKWRLKVWLKSGQLYFRISRTCALLLRSVIALICNNLPLVYYLYNCVCSRDMFDSVQICVNSLGYDDFTFIEYLYQSALD